MLRKVLVVCAAATLLACTAATDFPMPSENLYSLDDNLPGNVVVSLNDGLGMLDLALTNPLPNADDATLLGYLSGGTIEITVANDDTGVSFDLSDGNRVDDEPTSAGQYQVLIDSARTTLTVVFFNETLSGSSLQAGGAYTATFDVITNDYFATETFVRPVTVE